MNKNWNVACSQMVRGSISLGTVKLVAFLALLAGSQFGCQEFVHLGQISDGMSSWSIADAQIAQKQDDGTWQKLGATDGNGRWWILKKDIHGGGPIRITKPGYHTKTISEADFLNNPNILMVPDNSESSSSGWRSEFTLRLRFLAD